MFSFRLNEDFVSQYIDKTPPWGGVDAGGNSVGEVTFLRTYSRKKDDGTKETWVDVCRRVINGMYSIQKDHVRANRLPWSGQQAHASAQEAFDRLFNLKWCPPGRGLWMMGTPMVMAGNSAPLQNCFTGDTSILTHEGPMTLGELAGSEVEVYAQGWVKAEVKRFGEQRVQRVTFAPYHRRSNHRVVETVTPNHRWELRGGETTTALKVGDVVPASVVATEYEDCAGFIHGLVFADGSVHYRYKNGDFSHIMRLCGSKAAYACLFDNVHYQPNCGGDPVVYLRSGTSLKELPGYDASPEYVNAFIRGWVAFDGSGEILSTQNAQAVEWLKEMAPFGGFGILGINYTNVDTNYGKRSAPLVKVTLTPTPDYWTVKSIEPLDEPAEVFCPVVLGIERFTLSSGIYTSNCSFVSTREMSKSDPSGPFRFLMEASMLGIGVGFDTKGKDKGLSVHQPTEEKVHHVIDDTREAWVEATGLLLDSFLKANQPQVVMDYSQIRGPGLPIKGFGGTSSGPKPLMDMHSSLRYLFSQRVGEPVGTETIADIGNLLGVCVVSGNVRRSAELMIGDADDPVFFRLKDPSEYPTRNSFDPENPGWGWMSNNSLDVKVGTDYSPYLDSIVLNGEPGFVWMDVVRARGRMIDPPNTKDFRAEGFNPCAEQPLESRECCTLVETFLSRHESLDDFLRTLKFSFLYAKTVTLLPTHWPETNAIMQRNRRIGCSLSGVAQFAQCHGLPATVAWMERGYAEVQKWDTMYSEWLCVRESNRITTGKPSGTVSLLPWATPGFNYSPAGGEHILRSIRFKKTDVLVPLFRKAGYLVEDAVTDSLSVVVYFPVEQLGVRDESEVSIFEKIHLAALGQRHWSDNSISITVGFDPETEAKHLGTVLSMYEGSLKSVSFLPKGNDVYPQMPYTKLSPDEYGAYVGKLKKIDLSSAYLSGEEGVGEAYCTTDRCEIPVKV